jgi:hypothetical protein
MQLDGYMELGDWYESGRSAANALLDEFVTWARFQPIYQDVQAALDRIDRALASERALTVAEYQAACGAANWLAVVMAQHGFSILAGAFSTVSEWFPVSL